MQISRTRILPAAKSLEHVHYFCAESTSLILQCCSREPLSLFAFIPGFAQLCSFINVETHFSYFLKCTYNSSTGNCANCLDIFTSLRKLPLLNTLLSIYSLGLLLLFILVVGFEERLLQVNGSDSLAWQSPVKYK